MKAYYQDEWVTIYHADCREVLATLDAASVDLMLTDPPYGIGYRTPPSKNRRKSGMTVIGDNEAFNPAHLLRFSKVAVFGANHFADKLPASAGWIIWDKRETMPSNDQSDAELVWTNCLQSVRIVRCLWNGGGSLLAENGPARSIHPTQKPVRLMRAIITMLSQPNDLIVDPYMGTGTTLVAAQSMGRRAIGIEIEEKFCRIAIDRLCQKPLPLTVPLKSKNVITNSQPGE